MIGKDEPTSCCGDLKAELGVLAGRENPFAQSEGIM